MWKGFFKAFRPSYWKQADLGFPKTNFGMYAFELCEKADATPAFARLNLANFRKKGKQLVSILLYQRYTTKALHLLVFGQIGLTSVHPLSSKGNIF